MYNLSGECMENCSSVKNETLHNFVVETSFIRMNIYNAYLYFIMALGLPGNTLVLVVFSKHKPTTTTDWFILFITICDFVTLFTNVPVYITLANGVWYKYGNNTICRLHMFISQSVVLSSSFLICGLALDRYFRICKPMMSYPTQRARNICLLISISTTILSIPCIFMYENRGGTCLANLEIGLFVYYVFLFLTFIVAAVIVVFSYIKVNARIKESENSISQHNKVRKTPQDLKTNRISLTGKLNRVVPSSSTKGDTGLAKHSLCSKDKNVALRNGGFVGTSSCDNNQGTSFRLSTVSGSLQPKQGISSKSSVFPERKGYRQPSILITKISFIVCAVFIISWTPPWTSFIVSILGKKSDLPLELLMFWRVTYLVNTTTNPILYAWFNRKFRTYMLDILCCRKT